jgi:hypothetical protein
MAKRWLIVQPVDSNKASIKLVGRPAWLFDLLQSAGEQGVTTLQLPAGVRVSHYILILRRADLVIESVREPNEGEFSGSHVRYVDRSGARIIDRSDRLERRAVAA